MDWIKHMTGVSGLSIVPLRGMPLFKSDTSVADEIAAAMARGGLEQEVGDLRDEVSDLRAQLDAFRRQFE